jgi:hypothetical protein
MGATSMSQVDPRHSSSVFKGRWAAVRSDLIGLALLVVCLLAFVTAVLRWGDQVWEVIDGPCTGYSREHRGSVGWERIESACPE